MKMPRKDATKVRVLEEAQGAPALHPFSAPEASGVSLGQAFSLRVAYLTGLLLQGGGGEGKNDAVNRFGSPLGRERECN